MLHGSVCLHAEWECVCLHVECECVCMLNRSACLHAAWQCVSTTACCMGAGVCMLYGSVSAYCTGVRLCLHATWMSVFAWECMSACYMGVCLHAAREYVSAYYIGFCVCIGVYVCMLHGCLCLHGSVCLHAVRECVFAWECVSSSKKTKIEEEVCEHSIPVKKICIPRVEKSHATQISWRRFVGWNTRQIKTNQKQNNQ